MLQTTHLLIAKLKLQRKRNWTGDSCQLPQHDTTMPFKESTTQQELKIVLVNIFQVLQQLLEGETNKNGRQSKSHSHQHVRKFWAQKSNATEKDLSRDPQEDRGEEKKKKKKKKRQKSTTVVHEQEKPEPVKNILMLATEAKKSIKADERGIHEPDGNTNRRGRSPWKSTGNCTPP